MIFINNFIIKQIQLNEKKLLIILKNYLIKIKRN